MKDRKLNKQDLVCPFHEDTENCLDRIKIKCDQMSNRVFWLSLLIGLNLLIAGIGTGIDVVKWFALIPK